MVDDTDQTRVWSGDFGADYTDRNLSTAEEVDDSYRRQFGVSRSQLNREFLSAMDRQLKILEVGANVGDQLRLLHRMGFKHLYGLELQAYAIEKGRALNPGIQWVQGSAFDIPFEDDFFGMVFTSGVLIHVHPGDIAKALQEIHRCSQRYIWGCEYFSDKCEEVCYRGREGLMWKNNFAKLYLDLFSDLRLVKERQIAYLNNANRDAMFLLKKAPPVDADC